jgi:pantoate--beta-alanine ligase
MIIFKRSASVLNYLRQNKKNGKKIGFVPTMGALHQGHLSLIKAAKIENDLVVCSIFVNPTQFNNTQDFTHYPITIEEDILKLHNTSCHVLFLPTESEVYPPDFKASNYALGNVENILEGKYRPGHFQGVCQVMDRLLQVIDPTNLYMGQKDLQQCIVVKKLLQLTNRDASVHLHISPTVREASGLAMSSRNMRLSTAEKDLATIIHDALQLIQQDLNRKPFSELKQTATRQLEGVGFIVDYVEIAHTSDLSMATSADSQVAALVAATIGNVRLIDNLILN